MAAADPGSHIGERRAEIYTYESQNPVYALNWSNRRDKKFRLAVGSFIEEYENYVEIITLDDEAGTFSSDPKFTFQHPHAATKVMFIPDKDCTRPDLLATTGDFLRIWHVGKDGVQLQKLLNNNKNSEFCAPLTSFDWNETDPKRLGTSSIDTTCTIWDIEKGVVDTQLIAHDREVYDIAWGGVGVFASVSADGSVRVFDLRDKEHSTIIYESPQPNQPLLRLGWNKQDPRYMATLLLDCSKVVVLDIRFPTLPVAELQRHTAPVNTLAWAPHSSCHICTAGDDAQALIWDLSSMSQPLDQDLDADPILAYSAGAEVNQLQWSTTQPDWVAICFANKTQILRADLTASQSLLATAKALARLQAVKDRLSHLATPHALIEGRLLRDACFHNLSHEFLLVAAGSDVHGSEVIIDTTFREQFTIPQATEHYQELIRMLPAEFVGSPARLVPLAQLLCAEMGASFLSRGLTCPPWRQAKSLLSKWLPSKVRDVDVSSCSAKRSSASLVSGSSPSSPVSALSAVASPYVRVAGHNAFARDSSEGSSPPGEVASPFALAEVADGCEAVGLRPRQRSRSLLSNKMAEQEADQAAKAPQESSKAVSVEQILAASDEQPPIRRVKMAGAK
ncbi:hypothetical protein WJX81_003548 [Elliptochloris bilobata]|uniref:Uncharacterized protein n=1 Tax=Elliptochloris bilobata TaxID=381761 RepID=A0AAW1RD78_9CHLO